MASYGDSLIFSFTWCIIGSFFQRLVTGVVGSNPKYGRLVRIFSMFVLPWVGVLEPHEMPSPLLTSPTKLQKTYNFIINCNVNVPDSLTWESWRRHVTQGWGPLNFCHVACVEKSKDLTHSQRYYILTPHRLQPSRYHWSVLTSSYSQCSHHLVL
jgi:hypothetical protein